jgi:hypothetical protein
MDRDGEEDLLDAGRRRASATRQTARRSRSPADLVGVCIVDLRGVPDPDRAGGPATAWAPGATAALAPLASAGQMAPKMQARVVRWSCGARGRVPHPANLRVILFFCPTLASSACKPAWVRLALERAMRFELTTLTLAR